MATITGLTADRMIEIEQASVVDGDVVGNDLILTTKGGSQINAGNVRGPQGAAGPVGSDLSVVTAKQLLDIGMSGQIRAGRQLTASDFTNMGLSAPIGLWNLSNLNDSSGNGRNLSNKGSVTFAAGVEGVASTAAQFAGSAAQLLYINDAGASDPLRIKTGSLGCWFRVGRKGVAHGLMGKRHPTDGQMSYWMMTNTEQVIFQATSTGTAAGLVTAGGYSDVTDDRWHFAVVTCDGARICMYVDGLMEGVATIPAPIFSGGSTPFNIGSIGFGDASNNGMNPNYGRIDEAFITSEVLSDDQIRNLYCVKIPHTLSAVPKNVSLGVRRRKKGAALAAGDFPTQPLRLYNFSAGSLGDEGSNGQVLTNTGAAVSVPGVDGSLGNAFNFQGAGQYLSSTDAGLPTGTSPRSIGCWAKVAPGNTGCYVSYGATVASNDIRIDMFGNVRALNGATVFGPAFPSDGNWHFVVFTQDNSALDGAKSKLYINGRLLTTDTNNLVSIAAGGANKFRIGSDVGGGSPLSGQVDAAFVCGYALDGAQIAALYAKGAQALGLSPKNAGDHVELMTSTDLFCVFDSLETQHQIDLVVA